MCAPASAATSPAGALDGLSVIPFTHKSLAEVFVLSQNIPQATFAGSMQIQAVPGSYDCLLRGKTPTASLCLKRKLLQLVCWLGFRVAAAEADLERNNSTLFDTGIGHYGHSLTKDGCVHMGTLPHSHIVVQVAARDCHALTNSAASSNCR